MGMIDSGIEMPLASTVYFRTTNRRNHAFRRSHYDPAFWANTDFTVQADTSELK